MRASLLSFILLLTLTTAGFAQRNLSIRSTLQIPGQTLAGCWHYEDGSGKIYALVGAAQGIIIIDITDPSSPQQLFQLPGASSLWHEVKVQGDYAYAVSEGVDSLGIKNGLQIIDLRFLPDSAPNKFWQGDGAWAGQLLTGHTVTTAGNFVYVNGHNLSSLGRGVFIADISDPWNPTYVGAVTSRYCHDSYVRGDTIWTSDIIDGLFSVYDITNRQNPILLATQQTPGQFNHNSWLSDDGRTLFTTDERSNEPLAAFDVSDLSNISLLDEFYNENMSSAEVHNIRVINDYLINPSYGSQLTIADASDPENLIEVANFPTGSSLCWDADPYLSNGLIIATDMSSGIFYVFEPNYVRAARLEGTVTDSVSGLPLSDVAVELLSTTRPVRNTNLLGKYKTGIVDAGAYTVRFSRAGYQTKDVTGVNLVNGSLLTLDVQLVSSSIGIEEHDQYAALVAFPSPADEFLKIQLASNAPVDWMISDSQGRLVSQGKMVPASSSLVLPVNELAQGVYSIRLSQSSQLRQGRFIVAR